MNRAVILVGSYIAIQMLSDIGSLKIVLIAGFSMDAGTLVYPITFTLRDLVHKSLVILKLLVTAASVPLIYAVPERTS